MRRYIIQKKTVEFYVVNAVSQDEAEGQVTKGIAGEPVYKMTKVDLTEASKPIKEEA